MNRFVLVSFATAASLAVSVSAADLTEVQPVTRDVLMLRFDDGHIDYYGLNQTYNQNIVYSAPLNLTLALQPNTYLITSPDDSAYTAGRRPLATGRKAKGMDFNNPWRGVRFLQDHWIYLALPVPLQRGKTYTIALGGAAGNRSSFTFVFDEYTLRSDTIRINQSGFTPEAPKYAYLSHWMGSFSNGVHRSGLNLDSLTGSVFRVYDVAARSNVFSGTIAKRKDKTQADSTHSDYGATRNYTYADVWECNFSAFTNRGTYKVVVENIGCSYQFEIAPDVYRQAFYTAMRGLFFQRQGIVKEIEPGLVYPRSHHPADKKWYYDPSFKFWKNANHSLPGFSYTRQVTNIWGYYFDAGDWDGYPSHLIVPLGLMNLYDMRPDRFADGDVGNRYKLAASDPAWIDEGSDGLPDVLNEAAWLVSYCRRARQQLMAQGYGTGGVPDYTGRDAGADNASWLDTRDWALTAESPDSTYMYAAGAAYYACVLDKFYNRVYPGQRHPDSAAWEAEAVAAYNWAAAYIATNPADTSTDIDRAKCIACAALYRLTTNASYQTTMKTLIEADSEKSSAIWVSPSRVHFAAFIYLLLTPADYANLDTTYYNTLRTRYLGLANNNEVPAAGSVAGGGNGLRIVIDDYRFYMLGTFSTPRIYFSALAYALNGSQTHLDTIHHAVSYVMGGNEMNMIHMTGVGDNPERFAFHPDGWCLLDYNSKVYVNPPLPGYVLYAGDMTSWVGGIGDERWSHSSCWPNFITNWPRSEGRIFNRNSINSSEFTVPQSQLPMAFALGFVCGVPQGAYTAPPRPVVSLNLTDGQAAPAYGVLPLTVSACTNTARVEYFYEWNYIGESTERTNAFRYNWYIELAPTQTVLITAKAYDDKGTMSVPSDAADKTVVVIPEPAVAAAAAALSARWLQRHMSKNDKACLEQVY